MSKQVFNFYFISLFPDLISSVLSHSILARARRSGLVEYHFIQIRDFARDPHKTVDGSPYGGGEGMVLRSDVLYEAWSSICPAWSHEERKTKTIFLSPQGRLLKQSFLRDFLCETSLILLSGHYEGVDNRFLESCVGQELSIGDYILTGGELASLVLTDALIRLIPGVLGNPDSISSDSLEGEGLLKYPQYTKPRFFKDFAVPEILLSGDHKKIQAWRSEERYVQTQKKRPDLWQAFAQKKPPCLLK